MKPKINPNGSLPAFAGGIDTVLFHESGENPVQTIRYQSEGLTKRELFAAMAMSAAIVRRNFPDMGADTESEDIAILACKRADALLAELAKEPQP